MAYFRCGGGGIPASLKSGMNDVLNKKFGTSTTYPPAGWPDNVNLLGPLPIKTASGAISSFSDGADDVPIAEGLFSITAQGGGGTPSSPVPIVGASSLTVYQTGKNLVDFNSYLRDNNEGITFEEKADGGIRYYGTPTRSYVYVTNRVTAYLKSGVTYTFSKGVSSSHSTYIYCRYEDNTTITVSIGPNATSKTFTPDKNITSLSLEFSGMNTSTYYDVTIYPQVEAGNQATTFEKYKSKTPITVQLGQTVYGGTLAEDGTLTITHYYVNLGSWTYTANATYPNVYNSPYLSATYKGKSTSIAICDSFSLYTSGDVMNHDYGFAMANSKQQFYFKDKDITTPEDFKTAMSGRYLCYELETPLSVITGLDPISISTYYGSNNIYTDVGESAIQYRADIDLALNS